jgi:hypothetical protein
MIDPRTDNWAGYKDYNSSHHHRFPRSAREAGFYYGPSKDDAEPVWPVLLVVAILVGCIYWLG